MQRIQPTDPPDSDALSAAFRTAMGGNRPPLNLYRVVARNERLFRALTEGGLLGPRGLLELGQMDAADRELVILRTTARAGAAYEWEVHVAFFSRSSGLSEARQSATVTAACDDEVWSRRQRAIVELVDVVVDGFSLSDNAFARISDRLSDEEILEIIALAGMYRIVSCMARVSGVAREALPVKFPVEVAT